MKKIIFITGSYPPDPCGVGDYTYRLITELKKYKEIEVEIFKLGNFNFKETLLAFKYLNANKESIKIMQYPTLGYGWSVLPQILSIFFYKNMYINLHEFSQRKLKAKLATSLFFISYAKIIFTTSDEMKYATRKLKFLQNKSSIINIASNIDFIGISENNMKNYDLLNFGIIMPNKGLEIFFDLVKELRENKFEDKILLIGRKQKENMEYFEKVKKMCEEYNVILKVDMNNNDVAKKLFETKIAFLPFPDGVTFRRGSFLACLGNKVKVMTYSNEASEDFKKIKKLSRIIEKNETAFEVYKELLKTNNSIFETEEYNMFLKEFNWDGVTTKFLKLILKNQNRGQ